MNKECPKCGEILALDSSRILKFKIPLKIDTEVKLKVFFKLTVPIKINYLLEFPIKYHVQYCMKCGFFKFDLTHEID